VRDEKFGWDVWKIGEAQSLVTVGHTAVAGWPEPFPSAPRTLAEVPRRGLRREGAPRVHGLDRRLGDGDLPERRRLRQRGVPEARRSGADAGLRQAYNDFQLDWISPDPRRFIPILATPFWDPVASAREIERCAALGHRGVLFTGEPQKFGCPTLADRHWDPLWAAAQDAGLPISFHIGSGSLTEEFTSERMKHYGMGALNARTTVGLFLENGKQINDPPVLGRAPALPEPPVRLGRERDRLPAVHPRGADYTFNYSAVWRERPIFEMKPSEYFRRQVYGCYFFEEFAPQRLIDQIGADRILFETDYPHPVCLYGNVREKIDAGLAGKRPSAAASCSGRTPRSSTRCPRPTGPVPVAVDRQASERRRNCRKFGLAFLDERADRLDVLGRSGLLLHARVLRLERGADPIAVRAQSVRLVAWSADTGCCAISRATASVASSSCASGNTPAAMPSFTAWPASIHSAV
jgi:hypothetical protein